MWPILRMLAVLFAIASWFTICNHCALAAYAASSEAADCCANVKAPAHPPSSPTTVCCRTLRAANAPATVEAAPAPLRLLPREQLPFAVVRLPAPDAQLLPEQLDTGPPPPSFLVILRQRSLPAHGPPLLG